MRMSSPAFRVRLVWLSFAALLVHNSEEAIAWHDQWPPFTGNGTAALTQRLTPLMQQLIAQDVARLSYAQLLISLVIVSLLALVVVSALMRSPQSPRARWAFVALQMVLALNAVAHIVSAVLLFQGYNPGLVTALLFTLPLATWILQRAWRERWVSHAALCASLPVALVLHGPVLWAAFWLLAAFNR